MPFLVLPSVRELRFQHCQMEVLPTHMLKAHHISILVLSHNHISKVHQEALMGIEFLELLDLSHNYISCIEPMLYTSNSFVSWKLSHNKVSGFQVFVL